MGLGFGKQVIEHYDFGWSYSGFNRFRMRLAEESGIDLDKMDGFGEPYSSWDIVKSPIKALLNHSDCEGSLSYDDCETIYPELLKLIKGWPADDYDKRTATLLANAMKECADKSCDLVFC